jgi:Domain of unknown function (DUF5658)
MDNGVDGDPGKLRRLTSAFSQGGYTMLTRTGTARMLLEVFVYLQVLDVMSTLAGFNLGNTEASPFIRVLVLWGPVTGLLCSKLFAAGCVSLCIWLRRWEVIRWINYWYAALVVWNLYTILRVLNS